MSNTVGVSKETGTAYHSRTPGSPPILWWVHDVTHRFSFLRGVFAGLCSVSCDQYCPCLWILNSWSPVGILSRLYCIIYVTKWFYVKFQRNICKCR